MTSIDSTTHEADASSIRARIARLLSHIDVRAWLSQGSWAVTDKALFGASNFLANVLLARWMNETGYGAFAVAFSVLILILAFYNALVTEPMLVFGGNEYRDRFQRYVGLLACGHLVVSIGLALILAGLAGGLSLWGHATMASAFYGLAVAAPPLLFSWFMREACYVPRRPRLAAIGGGVYLVLMCLGIYGLYEYGRLTPSSVLLVMGGSSAVVGAWLAYALRVFGGDEEDPTMTEVVGRHWEYGRWAAASRVPMRLPGNLMYFVLPMFGGLAATGTLKALTNLIKPIARIQSALGLLLIPRLSSRSESASFFRLTRLMMIVFPLLALGYALPLGLLGETVIDWIYGGRYVKAAPLLWILGLHGVLAAFLEVMTAALRASERPNWIFWAHAIGAGISVPVTLGLIVVGGLTGAVVGMACGSAITLVPAWRYYARITRTDRGDTGDPRSR